MNELLVTMKSMHIKFGVHVMFTDKTLKVEDVQTFDVYQDGE